MSEVVDRGPVSAAAQFRALFRKNLSLQRRQVAVTILQVVIPVALIALIGWLQILVDRLADNESSTQVEYYGRVDISRYWTAAGSPFYYVASPPFFYFSANGQSETIGQCPPDTFKNKYGLLGQIDQVVQPAINITIGLEPILIPETALPFLVEKDSPEAVNQALIDVYRQWKVMLNDDGLGPDPDPTESVNNLNKTIRWYASGAWSNLLPFGAVLFNDYTLSGDGSLNLNYTAMAATRYGGLWLTTVEPGSNISVFQVAYPDIDRRGNVINMINEAAANALVEGSGRNVTIQTFTQGQPQRALFSFDLSSIAGLFTYGFVLSLLMPVFMANLVTDKQERVLLMMQMSGLRMWIYWLVAYIYDLTLYSLIAGSVYITSFIFQMRMFTQSSAWLLIIMFLLWGHAMIALCFCLSTLFSRARTASVVGYLIVIVGIGVSNLLNSSVFLAGSPPLWYMIYPPFAFYRAVFIMEDACIDLACFQLNDLFANAELSSIFWFLVGETVFLTLLTFYLHAVLPSEFGVRRSPFFFITDCFRKNKKSASSSSSSAADEASHQLAVPISDEGRLEPAEDEDVADERRRVAEGRLPEHCPVVIHNLRKEYEARFGESAKVAVHSLSLAIESGECFGLLGANGAGKTTLISVITGVYEPTSGTATLAGFSIDGQLAQVQRQLGVCPQFDIFYPELTAEEHLYFYARLKGCKDEAGTVRTALEEVGLWEHREKQARNLSGGMKRRLSLAIAIVGDPRIVVMDEPTTGLDPLTRRQIWEIIEVLKPKRSIILTTHSMEEADTLCTRIGIMAKGRLRCLGTQDRLKARFGSGYVLTVMSPLLRVAEANAFVMQLLPECELAESFSGTQVFRIAKEKVVVSKVFSAFTSSKPPSVLDWGLSMTTLEDVFLTIMRNS